MLPPPWFSCFISSSSPLSFLEDEESAGYEEKMDEGTGRRGEEEEHKPSPFPPLFLPRWRQRQ
jgi:hypothetical protein